jgi:hypothetical protein
MSAAEIWDNIPTTEDKVPRDRWQRPLIVPEQGGKPVAYTRVTTFAGSIEDMYSLGQWQQRMVALGLSKRPDLLLSVAAHAEDKDELNRIAEAAKEAAAASAAATTGSALHKLAERYDRLQIGINDVPASHRADLQAYAATTAPFTFDGIEEFVVLDDLRIAGTFDRIVNYDGQRYVADIKTGSIEYGVTKMAVQLALYSRGQLYTPEGALRRPIEVNQSAGIIIHLPAGQGRCELYWIDLRAGWDAVMLCGAVRAWRKRSGLLAAASFGTEVLAPPASPLAGTAYEGVATTVSSIVGPESKVGDKITVAEIEFTKIGDDPFNAPRGCDECLSRDEDPRAWCDCRGDEPPCRGTCKQRAHEPDRCPRPYLICEQCNRGGHTCPGCGVDVPHGTVVCLDDQIAAAVSTEVLEALWVAHRDEWTVEHTNAARARKLQLHQQVLKDAVTAT